MDLNIPVLFLVFNRPQTTNKVFNKIKEVKPTKLYVAADGPRVQNKEEKKKCEKARRIATNVDWDCKLETLFRKKNLGCKHAVSNAIDWFFKNEEMGIILEDDCVPSLSFFKFCESLLHRYANNTNVMSISGNNFLTNQNINSSYYFSRYQHCWGWASWSNSWDNFDISMSDWERMKQENFLSNLFESKKSKKYWENIFDSVHNNEIDSWAYIWTYSIWKSGGLNIIPKDNLVTNIGFSEQATHTKNKKSKISNLETKQMEFPLKHPKSIERNKKADKLLQKYHFQTPLYQKVLNKLKDIAKIQ